MVGVDWGGKRFAPDEPNQLIVQGDAPMLAGRLGMGVDIEAAEEAEDAFVRETTGAQDTNLLHEEGVCLSRAERVGCGCIYELWPGNYGDICGA
jgi:hypothetical protein